MKEILEELAINRTESLDLTSEYMSMDSVKTLAAALEKNKSVTKFTFELCNFIDEDFEVIAEALLKRQVIVSLLNFRENNLTPRSLPLIIRLMEKNRNCIIDCSYNTNLINDPNSMLLLREAARKNNISLLVEQPAKDKISPLHSFGIHPSPRNKNNSSTNEDPSQKRRSSHADKGL